LRRVLMTATTATAGGMTVERMHDFFDAWDAHDVERIVAFFTRDGEYLASAGPDDDGTAFRGIDEVRRGVSAFLSSYPDAHYTDADILLAGDRGIARWTFHGTTTTGTPVRYRGVDVFEFVGDKIRVKDAFRKERSKPIGT
jgi:ketosteroid isomerase-like protein